MPRSTPRTPEFSGTSTSKWDAPDFSDWTEAMGWDAETWDDLSRDQRREIASGTFLGEVDADTYEGANVLPVVEPEGRDLNENALESTIRMAARVKGVNQQTAKQVKGKARRLLDTKFDE